MGRIVGNTTWEKGSPWGNLIALVCSYFALVRVTIWSPTSQKKKNLQVIVHLEVFAKWSLGDSNP